MKRLALTLLTTLLAADASWAQGLPPAKIAALSKLAEEATDSGTQTASLHSATAPEPFQKRQVDTVLERLVDAHPKCRPTETEVKDAVIERYRIKFRTTVKNGDAVVKGEPSGNTARLCYYLVAAIYYRLQ